MKGGAIHWNILEPMWGGITALLENANTSTIKYSGNQAGLYGDNISCFP